MYQLLKKSMKTYGVRNYFTFLNHLEDEDFLISMCRYRYSFDALQARRIRSYFHGANNIDFLDTPKHIELEALFMCR